MLTNYGLQIEEVSHVCLMSNKHSRWLLPWEIRAGLAGAAFLQRRWTEVWAERIV